ncbi:hypothetical protein O9H85_19325 [Paenibacillus filicis]|uniref:NodB homology domain-containing protein n=1 Tax=Paenibacillus gyeongsangnamensis TaxID=3388067 RepID=A0ABT4QCC8_9BACL|nr:hypothetical protein [Paenibacillus filicis]MCZ8514534.1 hypothetical protein [Paenibacillus filicis]
MARDNIKVPYGYEMPKSDGRDRGSLWVYDSFEGYTMRDLQRVLNLADERNIARTVFYPLHEETIRRMERHKVAPYYARLNHLRDLLDEADPDVDYTIDAYEGKRKKYTPMDTAFRFLEEKYESPHFIFMTDFTANLFAGYESFEPWIKKVRLFVAADTGLGPHPRLQDYASRWDSV